MIDDLEAEQIKYKGQLTKGQKGSMADGGIRVPFIAYWKGKIQPGSVNEKLLDLTDVHRAYYEMLSSAMKELDQPFTTDLQSEKPKKKSR